jgi:hypothetical protein
MVFGSYCVFRCSMAYKQIFFATNIDGIRHFLMYGIRLEAVQDFLFCLKNPYVAYLLVFELRSATQGS